MVLTFMPTQTFAGNTAQLNRCITQETDGRILFAYVENRKLRMKTYKPTLCNLSNIVLSPMPNIISTMPMSNFGMRAFPHLGSYCWFTSYYEKRGYLLCPIKAADQEELAAPARRIDFYLGAGVLNYAFYEFADGQDEANYAYYRFYFVSTDYTYEVITYEKSGSVPLPTVPGIYTPMVRGYVDDYTQSELYIKESLPIIIL